MPTETESPPKASPVETVRAADWRQYAGAFQHLFLVGDLQRPVPHPFLRRKDVEIILCHYEPGDHGAPHWHEAVDEIEIVLEGRMEYREMDSGRVLCFGPGDLLNVRHGTCVERVVRTVARTLTVKLPSKSDKIHCRECPRPCAFRREPRLAP
jgi:quercetin dioxygenase-like cupin family protein